MTDKKMYVHQSIAQAVWEHGINTMFALAGDANLFFVNHFASGCGGKIVSAAHEGGAVLMALAYTQVTGNVGVATVTQGPGLTNCFTALREGVLGRRPAVLICGDVPATASFHPQNIDQREVVKATGAGFEPVQSPETASRDFANAMYRAKKERRPIVLNVPAEFNWVEIDHKPVIYPFHDTPTAVAKGPLYDKVMGMIGDAKRPLILAGAGAISAKEKIIELSEKLGAPMTTTLKGTGLFKGHPHNIGYCGGLATEEALDVIKQADCVIALGTWLHFFTTNQGALFNGKNVIQVNNSQSDIGRFYQPDVTLMADVGQTVDSILQGVEHQQINPTGFAKTLPAHDISVHPRGNPDDTSDGFVNFEYALDRLNEVLPSNRIMLTDGGRFITAVWCRVEVPDPNSFHMSDNSAAIGQGMQEAIGAAHGDPSRPVVLFTGDGGFMMGGMNEFSTAVRTNCDLIVIVCNDSAYGAEHTHMINKNMDPSIIQFNWPSFAEVAKSLGGDGIEVTSVAELEDAIKAIEKRTRPILVDLKLDINKVPPMRM